MNNKLKEKKLNLILQAAPGLAQILGKQPKNPSLVSDVSKSSQNSINFTEEIK